MTLVPKLPSHVAPQPLTAAQSDAQYRQEMDRKTFAFYEKSGLLRERFPGDGELTGQVRRYTMHDTSDGRLYGAVVKYPNGYHGFYAIVRHSPKHYGPAPRPAPRPPQVATASVQRVQTMVGWSAVRRIVERTW